MEKKRDKILGESIGKTVSVYYNDTYNSVSFKTGKFLNFDSYMIEILESKNKKPTLIPRSKCIRIELGGERQYAKAATR